MRRTVKARPARAVIEGVMALGMALPATAVWAADRPLAVLSARSTQPSGWQFQSTAYGWATALTGKSGVRNLAPVSIDMSFSDLLEKLNGAVMGSFLAKNDNWLILTDLTWAQISTDVVLKPPGVRHPTPAAILPGTRVELEMRQLMASAIAGYRLPLTNSDIDLYATAGIRYQRITGKIETTPGLIPVTVSKGGVEQWADPIIGLAATWRINDRWFVNALADVGGVGYRWTEAVSTALGYRAIYTDYRKDDFSYRVTQHGVFSSIAYHF
jgi:hypothetical protein